MHTQVTIFNTGVKFRLVSNFMELCTLTQAARSYVLLTVYNVYTGNVYKIKHNAQHKQPGSERVLTFIDPPSVTRQQISTLQCLTLILMIAGHIEFLSLCTVL